MKVRETDLNYYRKLREQERERYLAVSPYHDATYRWRQYEHLILDKYGPFRHGQRRWRLVQALDEAWKNRDKHHSRLVKG